MQIILVGFGFYVFGDENLNGGTVMPAILKWGSLRSQENINITCLVRSKLSKLNAQKRFLNFKKKYIKGVNIIFQIKEYNELDNSKKFDCAILAIPENEHLECLKFLVKKTTQIICVKPFTNNRDQFREALELSKKSNTKIFIDFHKRFDPANIEFIRNASEHSHINGIFTFAYGQKTAMPFKYFKKWSDSSNPFQYLAPHYLDIIFKILRNLGVIIKDLKISGSANYLHFKENPELISIISCNLKLHNEKYCYLINSTCNWMEPEKTPYNSRQRIEFQTSSLHLISEQDNRGQYIMSDDAIKIPNPHFMTSDKTFVSSGYGVDSFYNFFEYLFKRFPQEFLVSIDEYESIAEVIDYVNLLLKK